jgi:hypothetical protein
MSHWLHLAERPDDPGDPAAVAGWFGSVAEALLNRSELVAGGRPHRLAEAEFYYHGPGHPDPFTHRDPLQREPGRWYFHRTGGAYRSGSFKGLDLTFGDGAAHGGVLIRGVLTPEGKLIDGPSLTVDHLLIASGAGKVSELDAAVGGRPAWEAGNPLLLRPADPMARTLYRSARVGLTLRRARPGSDMALYVLRRYRFLAEPRRTAKGKPLLVLALHADGVPAAEIAALTGCPAGAVTRYVAEYEAGKAEADLGPYFGKDLTPALLCRMHGAWAALHGG